MTHSPSWTSSASWGPGVIREASERGRTPRHNSYSSGMFRGVLAPEDALWAAPAPWSRGRREKGGIKVTASSWTEPLAPQASPLTPLPSLSPRGEVLISPEPDTRQAPSERPLCLDSALHPSSFFLSRKVVGPECPECPQEPRRGRPGKGNGPEQRGHTMLLGKAWAPPW